MKAISKSRIVPVSALSDSLREEMYALFAEYYEGVSREQFLIDLAEKTHVFLFHTAGEIVGFSTIFRKHIPEAGEGLFLYSGDTVIRRDYWGTRALQTAFFRFILESKLRSPLRPVYWMLISKGFKTYLMMRKNFAASYPALGRAPPPRFLDTMNRFYRWKFGDSYRPNENLIHFKASKGAVKGNLAAPSPEALRDPEVRFFLEKNPAYAEGVELACIAEIRFVDFLGHVVKYFLFKRSRGA